MQTVTYAQKSYIILKYYLQLLGQPVQGCWHRGDVQVGWKILVILLQEDCHFKKKQENR